MTSLLVTPLFTPTLHLFLYANSTLNIRYHHQFLDSFTLCSHNLFPGHIYPTQTPYNLLLMFNISEPYYMSTTV